MPPSALAQRMPYGAHVIILFTLSFAVFILVILITFSSPFIGSINFLRLADGTGAGGGGSGGGETTFGAFGWCAPGFCLSSRMGYEYGTQVNKALTGGMVLWAVSNIFTFFTVLAVLPLLFVHESTALRTVGNQSFFRYSSLLAVLSVCIAWLFSIYGWSIAHRAFELTSTEVELGSAIWMGLAAGLCALFLGYLGWPKDAWDGDNTKATGGVGRGVPVNAGNGYYHYKRTTREVIPRV